MKKKKVELEELTKEELIAKCQNQKESLKVANDKIQSLSKELEIIRVVLSERRLSEKLRICMEETLSYVEEVERLKNEKEK